MTELFTVPNAHTCSWCQWTEVDSLAKTDESALREGWRFYTTIKFRNWKAIQGAAAGCEFFRDALSLWEAETGLPSAALSEAWWYQISFYPGGHEEDYDIFTGMPFWTSVDNEKISGQMFNVVAVSGIGRPISFQRTL